MTKLENDIKEVLRRRWFETTDEQALAIAKVCLPYIDKAFDAGGQACFFNGYPGHSDAPKKGEWMKREGMV